MKISGEKFDHVSFQFINHTVRYEDDGDSFVSIQTGLFIYFLLRTSTTSETQNSRNLAALESFTDIREETSGKER